MIDFGSKYNSGMYMGVAIFIQWSNSPAASVGGTVASYRTLTGMGV